LVAEAGNLVSELVPVVSEAMEMELVLFEPTPEFFDRIKPRRISGQLQKLAWLEFNW
tara:strand:+ start:67 stop:237 length:171 start_codon:yes stop_codon:yes gene_type:complete